MIRSAINGVTCAVGVLIVAVCIFLFVQCRQFADGDYSANTKFAQTVLSDVIRNISARSANGVKPSDVARAMYTRVSCYTMVGVLLIGIAWTRQYGSLPPPSQSSPE